MLIKIKTSEMREVKNEVVLLFFAKEKIVTKKYVGS